MPDVNDTSKAMIRIGTSMVCFLFRGAKNITARMLQHAIQEYLKKSRELQHGQQSLAKLVKHGSKLESLEITDQNIKAFERIAKKHGIDFSLEKDRFSTEPVYYVFFKSQDVEVMHHAFREYAHMKLPLDKEQRPSQERNTLDRASVSASKELKMDIHAELTHCKKEAAKQLADLTKGKVREIAPQMEPSR